MKVYSLYCQSAASVETTEVEVCIHLASLCCYGSSTSGCSQGSTGGHDGGWAGQFQVRAMHIRCQMLTCPHSRNCHCLLLQVAPISPAGLHMHGSLVPRPRPVFRRLQRGAWERGYMHGLSFTLKSWAEFHDVYECRFKAKYLNWGLGMRHIPSMSPHSTIHSLPTPFLHMQGGSGVLSDFSCHMGHRSESSNQIAECIIIDAWCKRLYFELN